MTTKPDDDEHVSIDIDEVLVERPDSKKFLTAEGEVWIPTSQIIEEHDDSIVIPVWLAKDRGLV